MDFNFGYVSPMDRKYYEYPESRPAAQLGKPIIPIRELGVTVPEIDQSGRFKNMLQNVDATIRSGVGQIQLVMMTSPETPLGGRPKAYGKEIREALREITRANDVMIKGVEMPTSMNNLSGFNPQQGAFSEEQRIRYLNEVKDAIKFASDIDGGGVDIVSFEFNRNVDDASWNKNKLFVSDVPEKLQSAQLVDGDTGQVLRIRKSQEQLLPFDPENGKPFEDEQGNAIIDPTTSLPQAKKWAWPDFEKEAKRQNERLKAEGKELTTPEKVFLDMQLNTKIKDMRGWAHQRKYEADLRLKEIEREEGKLAAASDDQKKEINNEIKRLQDSRRHALSQAAAQQEQAFEIESQLERIKPIKEFALTKSAESYADAGMFALHQTRKNPQNRQPIHVGPELGWPHAYGSHPQEFVELITKSRKKMVDKLVADKQIDPATAQGLAKKHIKGVLDTSHLGMWLKNFEPDNHNWDDRLKKFNNWFIGQIEWLAKQNKKHDLLGGIQVVDSASAAHGHLPPGQGIFPVKEAAQILRNKGNFKGFIVSEGHEEERFESGRIALKTWEEFGSPITSSYGPARAPMSWGEKGSYLGRGYAPVYMFGSYVPSNEFKGGPFWSGLPLE
jgi:hypothetical protein